MRKQYRARCPEGEERKFWERDGYQGQTVWETGSGEERSSEGLLFGSSDAPGGQAVRYCGWVGHRLGDGENRCCCLELGVKNKEVDWRLEGAAELSKGFCFIDGQRQRERETKEHLKEPIRQRGSASKNRLCFLPKPNITEKQKGWRGSSYRCKDTRDMTIYSNC